MPPMGNHWPIKHVLIIYYVQKVALQNFLEGMPWNITQDFKEFFVHCDFQDNN